MSEQTDWLANLKAGDEVIVRGNRLAGDHLRRIDKITATTIKVGTTYYRKSDGMAKGGSTWARTHIAEPSADDVAKIRRRDLCRYIASQEARLFRSAVPLETLESIVQAMKAAT